MEIIIIMSIFYINIVVIKEWNIYIESKIYCPLVWNNSNDFGSKRLYCHVSREQAVKVVWCKNSKLC